MAGGHSRGFTTTPFFSVRFVGMSFLAPWMVTATPSLEARVQHHEPALAA